MNKNKKGFTLLELLIVITIISVLSVILIVALNPAETLRKARDTQRLSDLASLKTAIGIYTTTITTPTLGSATAGTGNSNVSCQAGTDWNSEEATGLIYYSLSRGASDVTKITDQTLDGDTFTGTAQGGGGGPMQRTTDSTSSAVDGSGWVPVKFSDITGGSPISNLPLDPTNAFGGSDTVTSVSNASLMYRYACNSTDVTFEINAILESTAFGPTSTTDNKSTKDGGNNSNYYEVGTNLSILGAGTDF